MKKQGKALILVGLISIFTVALMACLLLREKGQGESEEKNEIAVSQESSGNEKETAVENVSLEPVVVNDVEEKGLTKKEIGQVPFQVQAPGGKWSEPLFQNGCEEASMIMAARWVKNEGELDADAMAKEMRRLAAAEERIYGHAVDTSVEDTCKTLKQVFDVENAQIIKLETIRDISEQLDKGNLIVVNAFGRALGNPNFTSPGPITHMLVIIGYDPQKKQIITNDPGTRNGRGYHYDENIFWKALWNYPTSKQHPEPPKNFGGPVKAIVVGR